MSYVTERDKPVAVVDRIAAIVNCVAEQPGPVSIGQIAKLIDIPKSTTARIVRSMLPHGLLEMQEDGVVLGLRFFELGERASRPRSLRRLTYAYMLRLHRETGHTVHLAVLDESDVVYIEIMRARNASDLPSKVGGRLPAHATAVGKVLLAFFEPEVSERVIRRGLKQMGPRTITDPDTLRAELWRARAQGFAGEQQESGQRTACVALPIIVPGSDTPVAGLSISGDIADFDVDKSRKILEKSVTALNKQAYQLPKHRQRL